MGNTKICIITICFNNIEELKETCNSIDKQLIKPFEHYIIDGSTNQTIETYLTNNRQPSYRKWICERDTGIANAFNKGLKYCTGNIVNMLNSGDVYSSDSVIKQVLEVFNQDETIQWLCGKTYVVKGDRLVLVGKPFETSKLYRGMRCISHQSIFLKKELHERHGYYNEKLEIAMDYDFICRICNEKSTFINSPLIIFSPGGVSSNYNKALAEAKLVYGKYFGYSLKLYLWQIRLKLLNLMLRTKLGNLLNRLKIFLKLENL